MGPWGLAPPDTTTQGQFPKLGSLSLRSFLHGCHTMFGGDPKRGSIFRELPMQERRLSPDSPVLTPYKEVFENLASS